MTWFDTEERVKAFAESLRTRELGKHLVYRQRTGSTNDLALRAARDGAPHGQVFVADVQDAGRGRRGRQWECPAGLGLLCSVLVRPARLGESHSAAEAGWIPLVTGLACVEAIGAVCGLKLAAKWPNDVVVPCPAPPGWRKLGGILCESGTTASHAHAARRFVVIGIGLNIAQRPAALPAQARTPPTSVYAETRRRCSRQEVLRVVLERLERHLLELHSAARGPALKHRLERELCVWWTRQRTLVVETPGQGRTAPETRRGRFAGLDPHGRLILQDELGKRLLLSDAEITAVI